ncbi:MAG: diguanylate cyclase [Nitrospirota bacterium]
MRTAVLITRDIVLTTLVQRMLKDACRIITFSNLQSSLDHLYNAIPDILIIDITKDDRMSATILNELKADPIFGQMPVLAVFPDDFAIPRWDSLSVDDYVSRAELESRLPVRFDLCVQRAERMVEVNPLTRLPGNITIIKQIQRRLDSGDLFALAYADLDFFKPFNDRYGFTRGDEVLKMLGRLILNTVKDRQPYGSFVGHIGGDDFVFIMDFEPVEDAAARITGYFDRIIPTFYDPEDRVKGYIESIDREGSRKIFPLMGLSIGITHTKLKTFSHYGEIAEVAAEMKRYAKTIGGSCYRIDKRQNTGGERRAG